MQNIKEYLSTATGTEGSLLIVKTIHNELIAEADKRLIPRSEAAIVVTPDMVPGSSYDFDLETPNTMSVRLVPEGSEIVLDATDYTSFNVKPKKYGVAVKITREMMEDSKFPLMARNGRLAGKRFAENETSLIINNALENASQTVTGGSAATIANLNRANYHLKEADYEATTVFVGNEFEEDLRNIDTFIEADKSGSDALRTGKIGVILGMTVYNVSTTAGMNAKYAYVIDREHAYVIVEKRGITAEGFKEELLDMEGMAVTQRIGVRHLRSEAIVKITTT